MSKLKYLTLLFILIPGSVFALSVLKVRQGGTGATSFTSGDCLKGNGTSAVTSGACGSGTSVTVCNSSACDYTTDGADDEVQINQAITYAASVGRSVYIRGGLYYVNPIFTQGGSIQCASNTNIYMDASTTILAQPNNSNPTAIIHCQDVENVHIDGGVLVGDRYTHTGNTGSSFQQGFGVELESVTNITVSNMKVKDMFGDGFYVSGVGSTVTSSKKVYLHNVVVTNSRRNGLSSIDWQYGAITDSIFEHSNGVAPEDGIDFESNNSTQSTQYIALDNVIFKNNNQEGFAIQVNGYNNLITNSVSINNGLDGFYITQGNNNTIQNSAAQYNTGNGIVLSGASTTVIAGNTLSYNGRDGISLTASSSYNNIDHNIIQFNNQTSSTYNNITVQVSSSYNMFSNNIVKSVASTTNQPNTIYGLRLKDSSVIGNILFNNDLVTSGLTKDLEDSGTSTIRNDMYAHTLITDNNLSNTQKGLTIYNTVDREIDYEKAFIGWISNIFSISIQRGGLGNNRKFQLTGNGRTFTFNDFGVPTFLWDGGSSAVLATGTQWAFTSSNSSGDFIQNEVLLTSNQSGTAGYSMLRINVTENSLGSGNHWLIDTGINGIQKFTVDNSGSIATTGTLKVFGTSSTLAFETGGAAGTASVSSTGAVQFNSLPTSITGNGVCITTAGAITNAGAAACIPSALQFKTEIKSYNESAVKLFRKIVAVGAIDYYKRKDKLNEQRKGLIADYVAKVDPSLVEYKQDTGEVWSLHFEDFTGLAVKAIDELDAKIEDQQEQIDFLIERIDSLDPHVSFFQELVDWVKNIFK